MSTAHEPGRNDPCPCGSGRKYKQCCLTAREREESARRTWRGAEGRVIPQLLHYAAEQWGREFVLAAWDEFFLWENVPDDLAGTPEFDTTFVPWLAFHYVPDPHDDDLPPGWPEETVARHFLRHAPLVDPTDRRFIEQAAESPLSFFAVTGTVPGRHVALRDVLTGREFVALEQSASATLERGMLLFSAVVSFGGAAIMVGCAPYSIPPTWHNHLIDLRERLSEAHRLERVDLFELDFELRGFYHRIADALLNPQLPQLTNTDGDPFEPTRLEYALDCDLRSACERLRPLTLSGKDDDLLADAETGDEGELRKVKLTWMKRGNRQHRDWDNTVLGHIEVTPGRLVAEVNSEKRARRLQKELKKLLGPAAVLVDETVTELEEMLAQKPAEGARGEAPPDAEPSAELQQFMREYAERHWEAWLNEKVPALGNQTPRQAAKTPLGRERLEALFAEYSWRDSRVPGGLRADVPELRRKLGLQTR